MKSHHIRHLYWRAGFGINPKQISALVDLERSQVIDALFSRSSTVTPLEVNTSEIDHFLMSKMNLNNPKKRKEFIDISVEKIKEFNKLWVRRLISPDELLRERMTLFWANHFVCRDRNIFHIQQYNNVLRTHALGNFGDFVKAVSKEASMLKYLNNKQNRKEKPNENFARELMELFTLGEGSYTENDIKESSRAFTGYNHNFKGEFTPRKLQHDFGYKTFLGHRGRYDGDQIIDIILEQRQCAKFICEKIYRYFVNDTLDERHINKMVAVFYPNYDIEPLMRFVFSSDWFYEHHNIGSKVKSPIDLFVGIYNTVPFKFENDDHFFVYQKVLGQMLMNPPNVAGWTGGKNWIDSSTIVFRLRLPSLMLNNGYISNKKEGDFIDAYKKHYRSIRKEKYFFKAKTDWNQFDNNFNDIAIEKMQYYLLNGQINRGTETYLEKLDKSTKRDFCVQLMSLPEYQMC